MLFTCKKNVPRFFKNIKQSFEKKKNIYEAYKSKTNGIPEGTTQFNNLASEYYKNLIEENSRIWEYVCQWNKLSPSITSDCFFHLLNEENFQDLKLVEKKLVKKLLSKSHKKFIAATLHDIGFRGKYGEFKKKWGKISKIPQLMSQLLTNYTSNVFSHEYPLIYFYYSDSTQAYDIQATKAMESVMKFVNETNKIKTCLDVGCAFGTAAFHAYNANKKINNNVQITCLDNNPYFERLASLIWKQNQWINWEKYFPMAEELFKNILGRKKGGEKLKQLLKTYNEKYSQVQTPRWKYLRRDYWKLADKNGKNKYDLIICNNFLHWPVIDFQRMNKDCSEVYKDYEDIGKTHLKVLLYPLLNSLEEGGTLVIVEPSQFFEDDDDHAFHESRFTNKQFYLDAQEYARNYLKEKQFEAEKKIGVELGKVPEKREVKFSSSSFQKFGTENDYKVEIEKSSCEFKADWVTTILGEFVMTLRNLGMDKIQKI